MLFNSFEFLFGFLPIVLLVFYVVGACGWQRATMAWLVAASLFFYGWWNPVYLGLLIGSIIFNYVIGCALVGSKSARKQWLLLGITGNLALLGYFKYANFFIGNANILFDTNLSIGEVILPLGISFFSFTQIAFLVDAYRGQAKELNFINYSLFVTYFPHLIAGPVLHHKEMMPQFARREDYQLNWQDLAVGLTVFTIGLFKKVVLADGIAIYARPVFEAAEAGVALTLFEAWGGVLSYSFQIYFDFSGYSDMAVGLSLLFGVRLPINFYSPYQAHNIIEFWRRWHITLSRFLRDYLYISLGGNRKGSIRRYFNLFATMLLGGLWHGASWNFAIWGGLHGLYLAANHVWHAYLNRRGRSIKPLCGWRRVLAIAVTFLAVTLAWVPFRAESYSAALEILGAMFGLNGLSLPSRLAGWMPSLSDWGVTFDGMFNHDLAPWSSGLVWLSGLAVVTWFMPNTQQIMEQFRPTLDGYTTDKIALRWGWYRWMPNSLNTIYIAILGLFALTWLLVGSYSEFLYFQF